MKIRIENLVFNFFYYFLIYFMLVHKFNKLIQFNNFYVSTIKEKMKQYRKFNIQLLLRISVANALIQLNNLFYLIVASTQV